MKEDHLPSQTESSLVLTYPAHERGEDLQIFGLLGVEEGEGAQHQREDGLREETDSRRGHRDDSLITETQFSYRVGAKAEAPQQRAGQHREHHQRHERNQRSKQSPID